MDLREPREKDDRRLLPIPRLLRPSEVAKILSLHPSSIYRLARRGVLPSVLIPPDSVRFRPQDVEHFIGRCRRPSRRGVRPT